jgi:hypothetical protein
MKNKLEQLRLQLETVRFQPIESKPASDASVTSQQIDQDHPNHKQNKCVGFMINFSIHAQMHSGQESHYPIF